LEPKIHHYNPDIVGRAVEVIGSSSVFPLVSSAFYIDVTDKMDTVYCIITVIGTAAVLLGTKIWLAKLKRERPILPLLAECLALLGHTAVEQRESRYDDYRSVP
jgi:hypothetical protein